MDEPDLASTRGPVARAVATTTFAVLPVALVAAFSFLIRDDLGFSSYELALTVGAFYVASAGTALYVGRTSLAERAGTRPTTCAGLGLTSTALAASTVATGWQSLACSLAVAGVGNGLIQPTANLALTRRVPRRRLGLAFGIKQAAVPGATFVAAFAVTATAVLHGWRWAFLLGAACAAVVAVVELFRSHQPASHSLAADGGSGPRPHVDAVIVYVVLAGALGSVANNTMRVFFVETAVSHGQSLASAGVILGIGSAAGVVTRLVGGWRSDHTQRDPLTSAGVLMLVGSVGYCLMAWVRGTLWLTLASVLGIAAGWGWAGLVQFGLVRQNPHAAGALSGFLHASTLIGSLVGPILFGLLAPQYGYELAWSVISVFGLAAGVVVLLRPRAHPSVDGEPSEAWS